MALFFARLPDILVARGFDAVSAGRYAFWTVAGFCVVTGLIIVAGLRKGVTAPNPEKVSIWQQLGKGMIIARDNPRIAVAYGAAFIGRGDLVIITTFCHCGWCRSVPPTTSVPRRR